MDYCPETKCREYREGWVGRRRKYICRECHTKFQADTLKPLPEIDRVCFYCRIRTSVYTFVDKVTGKETQIRASHGELASLRAWKINPNLTFKIPAPNLIHSLGDDE